MKITYLINCGLLVDMDETKILIDGLHGDTEYFDRIPEAQAAEIIGGSGIFGGLDAMIFTHCHVDHFDRAKAERCREENKPSLVFIPDDEEVRPPFMEKKVKAISVFCFRTNHSGEEYQDVIHYSFLIKGSSESVYISGDANFKEPRQAEMLGGESVDAAFFNPFHLQFDSGRRIMESIGAKRTLIYHIPSEKNDRFGIRKKALRNEKRHSLAAMSYELLLDSMIRLDF